MRKNLKLPFDLSKAEEIIADFGSPIYIYDEVGIRVNASTLNKNFAWAKGYKNYFAVKATPTPAILKLLHEEGMGFDCSSRTELTIMRRMGISGDDIFYTSNNTPRADFELAIELDATINLDDLAQVKVFTEALNGRSYNRVAVRYNPGDLKSGNAIIGEPVEAKYGMSTQQLIETFRILKQHDIAEFGLHAMVASNELEPNYFADTAQLLLDTVERVENEVGIKFTFINLGGGFGVNYLPDQAPFDSRTASEEIQEVLQKRNRTELIVFTENGRFVTGPHGYLLTKVQYVMEKYKSYVGLDASMHNLMRPGMYGAYHHISVLGKEGEPHEEQYDVVGSLCENNDKFAINRKLPELNEGDLLVIHDAGAHGHAMGFNYNGLTRSAETLLHGDGSIQLIRKAETVDQVLANIIWP